MKEHYDLLILNNCPAFYKINLYNEIAKQKKIFVVFIGFYDQVIIDEEFKKNIKFPFQMLNEVFLGERNKISSFFKLQKIIRSITYTKVIYGGYIDLEFILTSFIIPKKKNVLQTESASETKLKGIRFHVKKVLLSRFSAAIASGTIHKTMLRKMNFSKEIIISYGVGILNKSAKISKNQSSDSQLKFLYVGRLIELKNLIRLIEVFNKLGYPLTIVGKGSLENEVKASAKSNIEFLGFIENNDLPNIYKDHHVFILPSISEAWGLVVEEALYHGCVLCLSDRVGASPDLLENFQTGTTFDPWSTQEMEEAIKKIIIDYKKFKENVDQFDLEKKDQTQVDAYTKELFEN